jgi:hypothetical protein
MIEDLFDEVSRRAATQELRRRDLFKIAVAVATGATFGGAVVEQRAAANVPPVCNGLPLALCSGACAATYTAKMALCTKDCAPPAVATALGAGRCVGCLGAAAAGEIACMQRCSITHCNCPAGSQDCRGVATVLGTRGFFWGKQCCDKGKEDCTLYGCRPSCKPCEKRTLLTGQCTDACRPAGRICCNGTCVDPTQSPNCGGCQRDCNVCGSGWDCCDGKCRYKTTTCHAAALGPQKCPGHEEWS